MSGYEVARLEDVEELDDGRAPFRPVRAHLGISSFGVNAWTAKEKGDRLINEHDEADDGQEELYVVLRGHARFELDGENAAAPEGTLVHVQPGVKRTAFAEEPGTTLLALGGMPGQAYKVSGWEVWVPLQPLYAEGKYEEASDQGRELLEAHPDYAAVAYNVACCEALARRTEDAIEHLRLAFEHMDELRGLARKDSDLDSLRAEPAFQELVGA